MSNLVQISEIEVAASPEQVREALASPEYTRRYYFGMSIDSDWRPNSSYAYRDSSGEPHETGTVLEIEPTERLRMTSTFLFNPRAREDPPHRVTWEIERAGQKTRVRMTRDGYVRETATYKVNAAGMAGILQGLKNLLDPEAAAKLRRLHRINTPVIRELTPERLDDYLRFFDNDAFRDNPAWAGCYCLQQCFTGSDEEWSVRNASDNRRDMSELISGGRAEGLLAYVEDRLVAWCNVAPRLSLTRLNRRPQFQVEDAERVGSIACFVVAVPYHRHGIARQLLEAACERLARKGRLIAEAYPVKQADADAVAHRGPLRMHLDAGFKPYRETPGSIIVRKDLAPRA